MDKMTVCGVLSDCVNDVERQVWDMDHGRKTLALESIILRLDAMVDHVRAMDDPIIFDAKEYTHA